MSSSQRTRFILSLVNLLIPQSIIHRESTFETSITMENCLLVVLTAIYALQADNFQRQGRQLRRKMWFQNMKVKLIVLAIIIVIAIIIWLSICRGFVCHGSSSSSPAAPAPAAKRRLLGYIPAEIVN